MKKSTLFFKVMVLVALLVPWTAWGQDDVSTFGGGGKPWFENYKGEVTVYINSDGTIKSSDPMGSIEKGGLTLNLDNILKQSDNWFFSQERVGVLNQPVLLKADQYIKDYFSFLVGKEDAGELTIFKGSKDKNIYSLLNKTIKVKVQNHGGNTTGYLQIEFKKGQTDISDKLTLSYNTEKGSKPYDGKNISVNEAKDGLTILNNGSKWHGEYTITVEEGKDVGKYDITVIIKTSEYTAEKTFTDAYEITPKELTVTIKDQTKTLPGGTIETDASQWAEIKDKETAIISGDEVSLTGKIKEGEEGKLVADGDITTNNTNYKVTTVESGTLTVKYELTDENWKQILDVTGEGTYPYNGEEHAATVTGKDGIDLSNCIEIVYRKKIEQGGTSIIEGKPVNAGEYEIVIRVNEECDNVTIIGENKQITVGEITINKREITVTGSLTIKEGEPLKDSYKFSDIEELNATGIIKGEERGKNI